MKQPITEADIKALIQDDSIDGFAICDPDGKFSDDGDSRPWGVGLTVADAWHDFGYPSLNIEAYKKDGWTCQPRKLRAKKRS